MVKETIFALMLVTAEGAWEIADFESIDACEKAKAEVTQADSFCYKRIPMDAQAQLNQAIDTFIMFLEKFQYSIKEMEELDLRQEQALTEDQL